jgi:hypothetical protein
MDEGMGGNSIGFHIPKLLLQNVDHLLLEIVRLPEKAGGGYVHCPLGCPTRSKAFTRRDGSCSMG